MTIPVRSIRLQRRASSSLDTLSGSAGEIFFDNDLGALRLYTTNNNERKILADRTWVQNNTFSGDYNDLTNRPSIPSDVSQLSDSSGLLFSGDYNDLTNAPDLSSLTVDISTIDSIGDVDTTTEPLVNGQLLQWDGIKWQNATVGGFADTTYDLTLDAITGGVNLTLTGSDATTDTIPIVGAGDTTVGLNISNQLEINTTVSLALNGLSDTSITNVQDGQALVYNSGQWINSTVSSGTDLTSFSVTTATASGNGSLSYNTDTGVFTFTPPNLSTYASLSGFSVTTGAANSGGSLSYNNTTGVFTFSPAAVSTFIGLTNLSVTTDTPSGGGSLSYNNTNGVFTFTPAAGGDVVADTTPQLGGDLDLNNNDITGTGNVSITGTVSATSFSSSATGAPEITSASTITLTAPDGIYLEGPVVENVANNTGTSGVIDFDVSSNNIFGTSSLTGNFTPNFTNVAGTSNRSQTFIIVDVGTGHSPSAVQINGTSQSLYWEGGSAPSGTPGNFNVWSFTIISIGGSSPAVLGNLVSYA